MSKSSRNFEHLIQICQKAWHPSFIIAIDSLNAGITSTETTNAALDLLDSHKGTRWTNSRRIKPRKSAAAHAKKEGER